MRGIILASASPRRRELLTLAGFDFTVIPAIGDERTHASEPGEIVEHLARHKAREIGEQHREAFVIGADTIVFCDGRVLGKPQSREDAGRMIRLIAGRTHQVYTGVCFWCYDEAGALQMKTFHEKTDVEVFPMTEEEIEANIQTEEPYDKAGGYGIQGRFARYIRAISGDYYNVMGLPVARLYHEYQAFCI
ncbi:MAG: septum formation protein Maf [Lachnospiraceae bacterium]|nr:septum formation protein Maf [Lachnospiraceae bacterium]